MFGHDEPVRQAAALSAFGVALVNVVALLVGWSGEFVAALNILVGAGVALWSAFVVRERVTPVDGLHDRLVALTKDSKESP